MNSSKAMDAEAADSGAASSRTVPEPRYTTKQLLALGVVLSGAFMVVLDFFIVLVAIPSIQQDIGASSAALQLVVAGYATANAAGLIAGGRLGDIFGRRTLFIAGMALFTAASVGCGVATTSTALVLMRFAQGLAGALLQPQMLALLTSTFEGALRQKAFAAYAMAMGLAGACGQLLGGALIEVDLLGWGWRWCFLINLPIGLGSILVAGLVLPQASARSKRERVDWIGMALSGMAMTSLIWALTYGRETGSLRSNVALGVVAIVAAATLWLHQRWLERAGGQPMLQSSLFRSDGFVVGVFTVLIFYSGIASFHFLIGVYLQTTVGLTPLQAGLMFASVGISFFFASMFGPRLHAAMGRYSLIYSCLILALGHLLQVAVASAGAHTVPTIAALTVEGTGVGLVMAPLVARALSKVSRAQSGVGSGVLATMQSAGNALGVAVVTLAFVLGHEDQTVPPGRDTGFLVSMSVLIVISLATALLSYRLIREQ